MHQVREIGPIAGIFTEGKYKLPATANWDAAAVSADATGVLKEQASARMKRADIENEKYEYSKPKLHGVLSGMTTRDVDERIANFRNAAAIIEEQRLASIESKPGDTRAGPKDESQCPLALWKGQLYTSLRLEQLGIQRLTRTIYESTLQTFSKNITSL